MSDSIKLKLTSDWFAIPGLTISKVYFMQNITQELIFVNQRPTAPVDPDDNGFVVKPFSGALLIKEPSEFFIRMQTGKGTAFINEVVIP